ncbi:hypothetical protein WJX82_000687 [Trebouxia sp. C0006]
MTAGQALTLIHTAQTGYRPAIQNIYSSNVTQDRRARNLVMWSLTISQPGGKKEASADQRYADVPSNTNPATGCQSDVNEYLQQLPCTRLWHPLKSLSFSEPH